LTQFVAANALGLRHWLENGSVMIIVGCESAEVRLNDAMFP
jgi:hypothetical protein